MSKSSKSGPLVIIGLLAVLGVVAYNFMQSPAKVTQTELGSIIDSGDQSNPTIARLAFHEEQGRGWKYGVLAYGTRADLKPGTGSFSVKAGDKNVEIEPAEDALFAIGPDGKTHKLSVKFSESGEIMDPKGGEEFLRGDVWLKRLKPELSKYKWTGK